MGDMSGGKSLPGFLSTHPLSSERIKNVQAMLKPEDQSLARKPEAYLRSVENIVYGDDPRQGYVENSMFYHPELRFQFDVPEGWAVDNTPGSVTLVAADKNGGVIMQGGKTTDSPEAVARKEAVELTNQGAKLIGEKRSTINNLACYEQSFTIPQEDQSVIQMGRSYIKKGDWVYVFSAMSSVDRYSKYASNFRGVLASFRELTDGSKIDRAPKRLALVEAGGTDTLRTIFKNAGMPQDAWPHFAIMNGLDAGAVPPAGKLVKIFR